MNQVMDTVLIDRTKAKKLWYALFSVLHAIEQMDLEQSVNRLVDQESNMGAFDFARMALDESFVADNEGINDFDPDRYLVEQGGE